MSLLKSEYSTMHGLPSRSAKTPTFSCGPVFQRTLLPQSASSRMQYPTNTGSAGRTKALSMAKTWMCSTPRFAMSARTPDLSMAGYIPPFPSGAMAMDAGPSMRIFPPGSDRHGRTPCVKKVTSEEGRPKKLLSAKYFRVCSSFMGDVITYSGTDTFVSSELAPPPARFASFSNRSATIWNSVRPLPMPMSYMPLGPSNPSLVPCPPARRTAATLFDRTASIPKTRHSFTSAASDETATLPEKGVIAPASWWAACSASADDRNESSFSTSMASRRRR
mmetsp:Transcript_13231/g.24640  ORF Transcript_13231/g.24640 Transcript_13231/m.24640 type:complete len:277 (+) Transcript_13231:755-1585(+)